MLRIFILLAELTQRKGHVSYCHHCVSVLYHWNRFHTLSWWWPLTLCRRMAQSNNKIL